MKCLICGSELTLESEYYEEVGLVESHYRCDNCKLYSEDFAYGCTEIHIGFFTTGYGSDASGDLRKNLMNEIDAVCEALNKLYIQNEGDKNETIN